MPDRVWKETEAALSTSNTRVFFELLRECGALQVIFPEVDALFGIPQPEKWHPEIDTGLHTMMVLDQAELLSADIEVRFAALTHDLGKGTTPCVSTAQLWSAAASFSGGRRPVRRAATGKVALLGRVLGPVGIALTAAGLAASVHDSAVTQIDPMMVVSQTHG